jgi:TM2 domain-containing membrane protein YozV
MKQCQDNDSHQYYNALSSCPWCEVDRKFNVKIGQQQIIRQQQIPPKAPAARVKPPAAQQTAAPGNITGRLVINKIRFFEEARGIAPTINAARQYGSRFIQSKTRSMYFELRFLCLHQAFNSDVYYKIYHDGVIIADETTSMFFPENADTYFVGWGYENAGNWDKGTYTVEIRIGQSNVMTGQFIIEELAGANAAVLMPPARKKKSKIGAGLLGVLFGYAGLHNFYLGNKGRGALQLSMTILGLFLFESYSFLLLLPVISIIWGFVEGVAIFAGKIKTG